MKIPECGEGKCNRGLFDSCFLFGHSAFESAILKFNFCRLPTCYVELFFLSPYTNRPFVLNS